MWTKFYGKFSLGLWVIKAYKVGLPYRPGNSGRVRHFMLHFVSGRNFKKAEMSGILASTKNNVQFFKKHNNYGTKIANSKTDSK